MSDSTHMVGAFTEVSLVVPAELCDLVCDYIIENLSGGLILEEEEGSSEVGIRFYMPESDPRDAVGLLEDRLRRLMGPQALLPEIKRRDVRNAEWEEQYRQSVRPILIDDICIRPPWESPPVASRFDLIVEPRMAFGTGRHESTRLCLRLIRRHLRPGGRFLDLGCGSGILSLLAGRMGAVAIKAVDYDVIAVDNCLDNLRVNGIDVPCEVLLGSIERCDSDPPYDFVCVNIIKETILDFLPRLRELTAVGGTLVLAGLLKRDEAQVSETIRSLGLSRFEIAEDSDWIAYTIFRD